MLERLMREDNIIRRKSAALIYSVLGSGTVATNGYLPLTSVDARPFITHVRGYNVRLGV